MPQSIPAGLQREHVLRALADLDAGVPNSFGDPTKYELVHEGKPYAPKAVIGLACRHLLGKVLDPADFSGGEAPGQANHVLRKLGFTVVRKGEAIKAEGQAEPGKDWSENEVFLIVADYFLMLQKELLGQPYSKTEHRNALRPLLAGRSDGSIEFKHQNISAVMLKLGLPYIEGYKPRGNFQGLLAQAVDSFLVKNAAYLDQFDLAPIVKPAPVPADLEDVIEDPPDHIIVPDPGKPWLSRTPRRIDFVGRDTANRQLSEAGEAFVVELERLRLRKAGRDDLARKVDWVAQTIADGLGFDVLSFDEGDDSERWLEVKTTARGKFFPFYVTANEVRCSEEMAHRYHLYRVFDFSRSPRVYVLSGSIRQTCRLEPTQFLATI